MRAKWRHTDGRVMWTFPGYRVGYFPPGYAGHSTRPSVFLSESFSSGKEFHGYTYARLERATVPNLTDAEWFGPPGGGDGWTCEEEAKPND